MTKKVKTSTGIIIGSAYEENPFKNSGPLVIEKKKSRLLWVVSIVFVFVIGFIYAA